MVEQRKPRASKCKAPEAGIVCGSMLCDQTHLLSCSCNVPKAYQKILQIETPKIITIIVLNNGTVQFYNAIMNPEDVDGLSNSIDPKLQIRGY